MVFKDTKILFTINTAELTLDLPIDLNVYNYYYIDILKYFITTIIKTNTIGIFITL